MAEQEAPREDPNARRDLISKIGTFFVIIGLFATLIFTVSDISRNDALHKADVTKTYIVEAVQAIQTRDMGATLAAPQNRPTPKLNPVPNRETETTLAFMPLLCVGAIALVFGLLFKRMSAVPTPPVNRFEGLRKMIQKQKEAKAKREKEKKEKAEKAKAKKK